MNESEIEISIIAPMFNEEDNIETTASRLIKIIDGLHKPYEIIFVNDGSTDGTMRACETIKTAYPQLKIVGYIPNQGRGKALKEGFRVARGKYIFTVDFDLSYDESHIVKMYDAFRTNHLIDVVLVSAYMKGGMTKGVPKFRLFVSKLGNFLLSFSFSQRIYTSTCIVRGYKRDVIRSLSLDSNGKEIHLEILSKILLLGYNVMEIPGILKKREKGKSKFILKKTSMSHLLFIFTERPTYYLFILGIVFFMASIINGAILVFNRLIPNHPTNIFIDIISPSLVLFLFIVSAFFFVFSLIGKLFGSLRKEILKVQALLLGDKQN